MSLFFFLKSHWFTVSCSTAAANTFSTFMGIRRCPSRQRNCRKEDWPQWEKHPCLQATAPGPSWQLDAEPGWIPACTCILLPGILATPSTCCHQFLCPLLTAQLLGGVVYTCSLPAVISYSFSAQSSLDSDPILLPKQLFLSLLIASVLLTPEDIFNASPIWPCSSIYTVDSSRLQTLSSFNFGNMPFAQLSSRFIAAPSQHSAWETGLCKTVTLIVPTL